MKNEIKHTAHSTYRCEYHIVFAPKYRRKEIYGQLKKDIGEIIRKLCNEKKVEIIEAEACPDHIHMLVSVPPYISIAQFMGFLKGKSALMIFDRHANLKYKYGSRNFWCRGYYVDTVTYLYGHFFMGTIFYHFLLSDLIRLCNQDKLALLRRAFVPDIFYIRSLLYLSPARG